ncbi:hypothetical protein CI109_105317 [Kwoniella shandongensis]|uniref:Uncharacterized protein n=1 Tax=Kwoniella shandongensis TaxID=1734106 RepID=A0A5M6BWT5_9TREE|nr:uncharacterized protein CI109_005000 [Kwoniella shandongensis]KAA5526610.1 hypothetical protein CI109_005000 [Kwoniella shandongensis]
MSPTPLPAPRRILVAHSPTSGEAVLLDDTFPHPTEDEHVKAQVGYIQAEPLGDPSKALEWAESRPKKISHDDQISIRWVDIPPNSDGALHFTDTFDYLVITHGEAVLVLHDGTTKTVTVGDVIVQIANIHAWSNKTSEWARFFGVVVPSKPFKLDGKGLEEAPFNGYHAQF